MFQCSKTFQSFESFKSFVNSKTLKATSNYSLKIPIFYNNSSSISTTANCTYFACYCTQIRSIQFYSTQSRREEWSCCIIKKCWIPHERGEDGRKIVPLHDLRKILLSEILLVSLPRKQSRKWVGEDKEWKFVRFSIISKIF